MKKVIFFTLLTSLIGCTFITNYFDIRKKSIEFIETLLDEDYARCVSLMPVNFYADISLDSTRTQLLILKTNIDKLFGKDLKATFIGTVSIKTYKTVGNNNLGPILNEEFGIVQLSNDSCYGNFQIKFDKKSMKIYNIELMFIKTVPDKTNLYVFGTFGLIVLIFNLLTIWKLIKSTLAKKWLWVIAIVVLNLPVIVFSFAKGLFIQWVGILPCLGVGYSFSDLDSLSVMFGIPIGAFWVWYKLSNISNIEIEEDDKNETPHEAIRYPQP